MQVSARQTAPTVQRVIVVTNANDTSVNNALIAEVVAHWQADGAHIETYEFPLSQGLIHDLIDPDQQDQKIEVVYPELIDLATH